MKICIFGSSFNPPHNGHLQMANHLKRMDFDRVLIVPTGNPNHKQIGISDTHRRNLVLLFQQLTDIEVSFHEMENDFEYTYQSLEYLNFDKDDEIYFALGADSVNTLPTWDYFPELRARLIFIIFNRPGISLDSRVLEQIEYRIMPIEITNVSSTQMRICPASNLIPPSIYAYIIENNLFQQGSDNANN